MKKEDLGPHIQNTFRSCVYQAGDDYDFSLASLSRRLLARTGSLTFDRRYAEESWANPNPFGTPFKEIKIAEPQAIIQDDYQEKLCAPINPFEGTLREYTTLLKKAVISYMEKEINTSRPTLICHSGGYDSRIISFCMKEMRESGFDFGKVHFRSHDPENDIFIEILRRQKCWKAEEYSPWDGPAVDYYDIGRKDLPLNGWHPYMMQFRFWKDLVPAEEEKNWNIILGLGGGELFDYPARGMRLSTHYKRVENGRLNQWLNYSPYTHGWATNLHSRFHKCLVPFFGYEYLDLAVRCPDGFMRVVRAPNGKNTDAVRADILKSFGNDYWDYGVHDYRWNLSSERRHEMLKAWKESRFRNDHGEVLGDPPFLKDPGGHSARLWGFMTVYDAAHDGAES